MDDPLILLFLSAVALSQSGGGAVGRGAVTAPSQYDLSWWTVDGGGASFGGGAGYALGGTAGQPDTGAMSGGDYALGGGFLAGGAENGPEPDSFVYLPLLLRQ